MSTGLNFYIEVILISSESSTSDSSTGGTRITPQLLASYYPQSDSTNPEYLIDDSNSDDYQRPIQAKKGSTSTPFKSKKVSTSTPIPAQKAISCKRFDRDIVLELPAEKTWISIGKGLLGLKNQKV
ncbi:hypothetical protein CTI12_AA376600 [Artemisia annua]|uniref:Uncharacterized protein n=1 Tax=Artemisia annua TaxID=35608 RepID=A0A2U1MIG4_ARTAN|nr:hypothetical protein CTI12_AA376600 [Artemisia annua]